MGAAAFVAAIWTAVLLYLGTNAKWNVWNICLVSGIGLLTLACCIYGDSYVRLINFLLILCGSALAFFSLSGSAENALRNIRVVPETFVLTFRALFGNWDKPFRALKSFQTDEHKSLRGVLIGLLLGLPLLVLVIWLLSTADAVFGELFGSLTRWLESKDNFVETCLRVFRVFLYTLLFFSALYYPAAHAGTEREQFGGKDSASRCALCHRALPAECRLSYLRRHPVRVPLRWDGGRRHEGRIRGVCEKRVFPARCGNGHQSVRRTDHHRGEPTEAAARLCSLLLVLTCVILFSAFWRMRLYISAYGMSLLRAMTLWAMAFIAVCLVLAAFKVWRPDFRFWPVFAALGLAGWIVFNFLNIDARIADYNVNAYLDGRLEEVDIYYLARLSPDVIPALERLRDAAGDDYAGAGSSDFYLACDITDAIDGARGRYHAPSSWRDWCWSYVRYQ